MSENEVFDPFAGGVLSQTAPVTPEQEEIWLSVQLGGTPASLAYNEALELSLTGALDEAALRRTLNQLVERHEALRTTLSTDGALLCIVMSATMKLSVQDLTVLVPADRDAELRRARTQAVTEPFDLVRGPLVRCHLLRLSERQHVLIFVAHHIVCDGWSAAVLVRELGDIYTAERQGRIPTLAPAASFARYACARRAEAQTDEFKSAEAYWLAQYREPPPSLGLPLDHPRPPERSFAADRVDVALPPDVVKAVQVAGARASASFAATMLAAFQVFLHRLSGQRSLVVGMPAAGQAIAGEMGLVGHCVRTLPMRSDIDLSQSFASHVSRTKSALFDATDHAQLSFGGLIKQLALPRDASRAPLVAVMFNVEREIPSTRFEGLEVTVRSLPRAYETFELFINGTLSGETLVLETSFSTALFERASIERRLEEFSTLLEDVARDPNRAAYDIEVIPPHEKACIAAETRGPVLEVPAKTLPALFLDWAARAPDRPAVVARGRTLSYRELARRSAALAARLRDAGVRPGQFVGVSLERSVDLVVALLGILRSGAAYVPIDPQYPRERRDFITGDARLVALVTERALIEQAPSTPDNILLEEVGDEAPPDLDASLFDAGAYVIYTSGSTGQPKGVVVLHRNLGNFVASIRHDPGLSPDDVVVAVTTPSFDISVLELLVPLAAGAQVAIATGEEVTDGAALQRLLERCSATVLQATPSGFRGLIESGWIKSPAGLRILTAGEPLLPELARELRTRGSSVYNGYGPTETTIWSTYERVDGEPITIGRPLANTVVYVLDERRRPVPHGVTGELYIGGAGVSAGYIDRPELNRERFLADPFAGHDGARMYRTGDLVRLRWDGRIDWLGRLDFQVKVRGHRIELGEIEARLGELPDVREAVVTVREERAGDQRIVAYVRPVPGKTLAEAALTEALRARLPAYMLPQHFVVLTSFPLTPNGKVDRRALPVPQAGTASHRPPQTELQKQVAEELFELLGVRMGLEDDFFALGGHSLLALRFAGRARARFGIEMPVRVIFSTPTLQGLADFVEAALALRSAARPAASALDEEHEELLL